MVSSLLVEPTRVLVLTADGALGETLRDALAGDDGTAVEVVERRDRVIGLLEDRKDVGCVVATDDVDGSEPLAAVESLREAHPLLPIVYYARSGSEDDAWAATASGADCYVHGDVPAADLRARVETLREQYDDRRWQTEESDMFRALLDILPGSVYVKDEEGRHVVKTTVQGDVSPERARGKTDLDIYDDEESYAEDLRVIQEGEPIVERESTFDAPETTGWLRTTKRPFVDDDGTVKGLVGRTLDVTDEVQRREQLAEHERRLSAVADTFTHDLRTPLQLAGGYLEQARVTGDDAFLDEVDAALDRIDEMLDDLRSLVDDDVDDRLEDVAETLPDTPLVDVAEDVWSVVGTDDATLDLDVPVTARVQVAAPVVRQVLENLFKNGIDHAGPDVDVRLGLLPRGGFYVEDDGPGIPTDEREAVRRRGYTTSETGSGIGLGVIDEIADRYDWDMVVTESATGGARIELGNCLSVGTVPADPSAKRDRTITESADVGVMEIQSSSAYDESTDRWTLEGGGRAIIRDVNEFHYAYATVTAPARIEARLVDLEETTEWTTAGIMLRDGLSEDAPYACIGRAAEKGICALWRRRRGDDGSLTAKQDPTREFDWVRARIEGDAVTLSASTDGSEWRPVDQREVAHSGDLHAGLVVCSTLPHEACRAVFESVTVSELEFDEH